MIRFKRLFNLQGCYVSLLHIHQWCQCIILTYFFNLLSVERNRRSGRQHPMSTRRMVALYDYDPRESSPNVDVEVQSSCGSGCSLSSPFSVTAITLTRADQSQHVMRWRLSLCCSVSSEFEGIIWHFWEMRLISVCCGVKWEDWYDSATLT